MNVPGKWEETNGKVMHSRVRDLENGLGQHQ